MTFQSCNKLNYDERKMKCKLKSKFIVFFSLSSTMKITSTNWENKQKNFPSEDEKIEKNQTQLYI